MTQLFLNPLTKFTSDNITALPGARLYFYQNNSSTPKAVYADKNKVTSLGVYVEADSAGIFEPIWLDGTYRATLKYSTNWTTDPVGVVQTGWPIDDVGDSSNFTAFAEWDPTFTYDITTNTFVTGPDGKYYKSIQNPNLNKNPTTNADYWEEIRFQSVWNPNREYVINDIVEWEGFFYSAITTTTNNEPPNGLYWNKIGVTTVAEGKTTGTLRNNTATLAADADLVITDLDVGSRYHLKGMISWNDNGGGAANGMRIGFDHGNSTTIISAAYQRIRTGSTAATSNSGTFYAFDALSAGSNETVLFDVFIQLNSGTQLALYWAQNTSSATNTTLNNGFISATKVG